MRSGPARSSSVWCVTTPTRKIFGRTGPQAQIIITYPWTFGPSIYHTSFVVLSALDDCRALRHVMEFLSARLGIGLVELHRRFAVCFDEPANIAQVQTLLEDYTRA